MRSRAFQWFLTIGILGGFVLPALVFTQGTGSVYNPRLRRTYPTVNEALAQSRNGDTLLIAGRVEGAVSLALAPGGITLLGRVNGGIPAVISVGTCPPNQAVIDARGRRGHVQIVGLNIEVPSGCYGILSGESGIPLTVRNCRLIGRNQSALFSGIALMNESGGPFLIQGNQITNQLVSAAILIDGRSTSPLQAIVRGNRIGSDVTAGIIVSDIPPGSSVIIERNVLDGGDLGLGAVGILLNPGSNGVVVQRNTILNFGTGIIVDGAPGSKILANHLQDNRIGIAVDTTVATSGTPPVINDNNITCTSLGACRAAGAEGLSFVTGTYTLDARNNYWGASTGPDSAENPAPGNTTCPEATGSNCAGPAGGGTGLPINAHGVDCSASGGGSVRTCPIRTAPNRLAGA
ncbi:MAG: right-handed parallel beta-helix repeat-containing protein [Blastocatellia bacterium]|nr:right-handed parallel beta-helix repeat-containing protein [Blastocatellia bacterium]MCS7156500.1 right-handed parallel beta-helix repeat-containing protein [Blastocatellia bacterium]MCX7751759.1 right-handed parallel beta-helix repeat-containing protein [Blastocatellia bacterium]MDW8168860.1 right-handed parallel beta-helix repeat-containing protein [Acidobacteriota bacterium]MDW8256621.1 right-handed parallel beta-helix repeat-containing protein [Acidobacteriota bacterium]